ncbi:MAG: hypothetical protein J3Q66DRAFT_322513 [Benniella sp.]|nr:MAG: hypothetical protein J3Q66DRAFT_322513 [Benniella sp.]
MKNFHLFLVIGAALQMVAHGAPITDRGVFHTQDDICRSEACTKEAENILKDLKKHMDPCIDFEQFVCGGFFERATTPGQTMMDSVMEENTKKIAYGVMNATDPSTPKPPRDDNASLRNIRRMHSYFAACMNETQHKMVGREPLVYQITEKVVKSYSVPGSPIEPKTPPGATIKKDGITGQFLGNGQITFINPSEERGNTARLYDLSVAIGYFLRIGLITFIDLSVSQDHYDQTLNRMTVKKGKVGLPARHYPYPTRTQPYEHLIGDMFYILYADNNPIVGKTGTAPLVAPQEWHEVAKKVFTFEKAVVDIADNFRPQRDAGLRSQMDDKLFTVEDLNQLTPSLDWKSILRSAHVDDATRPLKVVVDDEDYLKDLDDLLSKTDRMTIQLFFAWSMIRRFGGFLDKTHRRNIKDYELVSDEDQDDRNEYCYKKTLEIVPDIIGHYFVEATLPKPARDKLEEIIKTIRKSYSMSLQSQESHDWLETSAREGALKKIENLAHVIGYSYSEPDNRNSSSIDKFYSRLGFAVHDHLGNQVRASEFWTQIEFEKVAKKFDRMHMKDLTTENNSYNRQYLNSVYFLAGDLQSPLFNVNFPEYLNYGGFGATTGGHEITHTFDNDGIKYDENGNSGSDWFDNSLERFKERAQCFIYQYGNFTIPDSNGTKHYLDGTLTLGENIADNGGIRKAYWAWFERYLSDPQSAKHNNKRLQGLEEYSPEQMFFIQYARGWCTQPDPKNYKKALASDHSPAKYRIIGVVQNSDEFANAFKCRSGTPMNPVKSEKSKCKLW